MDTRTHLDAEAYAGSYGNVHSCAYCNTDPNAVADSNSCSYSYSHPYAYTDTNSYSSSNGHGNADTCTYTNTDTVPTIVIRGVEGPVG